ncbi:hypothetical protein C1H76_8494 [Elsinoe australis]|uniref:Uncharacterized protein n=1 Tax=Elsinoe australis TaxID=40998 RepID=A0A4U7AMK5_9PEZI|nr:hypothetical protein C1H76_8494 [Elsinoe australis]
MYWVARNSPDEVVRLIEHDSEHLIDPNNAQQHHLTWLIGFVCGV